MSFKFSHTVKNKDGEDAVEVTTSMPDQDYTAPEVVLQLIYFLRMCGYTEATMTKAFYEAAESIKDEEAQPDFPA